MLRIKEEKFIETKYLNKKQMESFVKLFDYIAKHKGSKNAARKYCDFSTTVVSSLYDRKRLTNIQARKILEKYNEIKKANKKPESKEKDSSQT